MLIFFICTFAGALPIWELTITSSLVSTETEIGKLQAGVPVEQVLAAFGAGLDCHLPIMDPLREIPRVRIFVASYIF